MRGSAAFGGKRNIYRYELYRDWRDEPRLISPTTWNQNALFIMLNPSTADHKEDDPTVAKCIRLARRWGFGGIEVRNIFAYRSTDPDKLTKVEDPIGPDNDLRIIEAVTASTTAVVVAAWGNGGIFLKRGSQVRETLYQLKRTVHCFGITDLGQPGHPLYQKERDLDQMRIWLNYVGG